MTAPVTGPPVDPVVARMPALLLIVLVLATGTVGAVLALAPPSPDIDPDAPRYPSSSDNTPPVQAHGLRPVGNSSQTPPVAPDETGPADAVETTHSSPNFSLTTDLPAEYASAILAELERAIPVYRALLAPHIQLPEAASEPHRVRVFESLADFLRYRKDVWGEQRPANNFAYRHSDDPAARETIGYFTSRRALLASLRHECFHQVLRREVPHPAQWLNEGLAEYVESNGRIHRGWARTIREQIGSGRRHEQLPLSRLLQMTKPQWLQASSVAYPLSWAVVWYLREQAGDAGRALLGRMLATLSTDADEATNTARVWSSTLGADNAEDELQTIAAGFARFLATVSPTPRYDEFTTARQLLKAGDHESALRLLDAVLAADADFAPGHHYRARTLAALDRDHEALVAWLTALDIFPQYPAALISAAESALEQERWSLALALAHETSVHGRQHSALGLTIYRQLRFRLQQPGSGLAVEVTDPPLPRRRGWRSLEPKKFGDPPSDE